MRIFSQPGRTVRGERPGRISRRPGPDPGLAVATQVTADRLAVPPEVTGDR